MKSVQQIDTMFRTMTVLRSHMSGRTAPRGHIRCKVLLKQFMLLLDWLILKTDLVLSREVRKNSLNSSSDQKFYRTVAVIIMSDLSGKDYFNLLIN